NGDVFTTLGLGRLLTARRESGVASALAVVPNERPDVDTPLWSEGGRLVAVGGPAPRGSDGPWLFTGIQAATASLLQRIPEGKSELAKDVLRPSLERGERAFALVPFGRPGEGRGSAPGGAGRGPAGEGGLGNGGLGWAGGRRGPRSPPHRRTHFRVPGIQSKIWMREEIGLTRTRAWRLWRSER